MIYDLSNKWYAYVDSYRDDMQYDYEREWYSEHPVNEDNLLAVGKALDDWYWEIRQKQADAEAELAEQQDAEAAAEQHEETAEEAPVESSNAPEDVATPPAETSEGNDPADDTPANDATASGKPEDNQLSPTDANAQGSEASLATEEPGRGATIDPNNTMNKGTAYPVIKINDTYISQHEIVEFYVETGYFRNAMEYQTEKMLKTGFVPTMHLVVQTLSQSLFKQDTIKAGDKCNVFFRTGSAAIRSYRGTFVITKVITDRKPSEVVGEPAMFVIDGELWVPGLRNEAARGTISETSRNALMEIAKQLQLGFFFVDPDDTDDYQTWQIQTTLADAAMDIAAHAWKEFDKFYDCFIDPRYGLSFLEVNKLLIADGLDEQIDVTAFANTIYSSAGIDGRTAHMTEEEQKQKARPEVKIFSNIVRDPDSVTPLYVKAWSLVNQAAEITSTFGVYKQDTINTDNPGVATDNTAINMDYSIPMNQTKLKNGFYVLIGPGINITYTQADQINSTQSFVQNAQQVTGGGLTDIMSDGDADQLRQTGSNAMASGNVNKFYDVGYEHNKKNLLQLEKQYLQVELAGCNLGILRGEKIPVLLLDNDILMQKSTFNDPNEKETTVHLVQKAIFQTVSGWYIIGGIMWEWKRNRPEDGVKGSTLWRTHCKLKRREWPIVGYGNAEATNDIVLQQVVDTAIQPVKTMENADIPSTTSSEVEQTTDEEAPVSEGVQSADAEALDVAAEDNTGGEVPLTGLKEPLKDVYRMLKEKCPGIKLVSARRWAVGADGQRTEGNAFLQKNGLYKCVNAKGQAMYFKNNNSRHLYGEAFDIVNAEGQDFQGIMTNYVLQDAEMLKTMYYSGISACVETTQDDSGVQTKHYHFGTDPDLTNKFWMQTVRVANETVYRELNVSMLGAVIARKRVYTEEITNTVVQEA